LKAISYARFSTDRQSESSVDDQLKACREYARARGWTVIAEYSDHGISGAALGNRPGALEAIAAVGPGDVLLITDLSRLSRSQDLAPLLSRMRHRGARAIGVQDGFDSESRTARMQAGMSGIMSEEFRSMIADRVHAALEYRARDGRSTGGKAYGNAELVREIFERFAAGETLKVIAGDLNRRGIPSPGASWKARSNPRGKWLVSALHALLRNEKYIGREVWNRSKWIKDPDTGKRIRRERPESEWIVRECAPMVDRETWNAVQARFKTMTPQSRTARYLLSGILECGVCGSKLVISGGAQRRYRCGAHHQGGVHACTNAHSFPMKIAEDMILEPVMQDMLSDAAIALGVKALKEERPVRTRTPVNHELRELERLVEAGILSAEVAAPSIEAARRKNQDSVTVVDFTAPRPTAAEWREYVMNMRTVLQGQDIVAARDALRELVGPISCVPAGDDHVKATMAAGLDSVQATLSARQVMLRTGTGSGIYCGSGGPLRYLSV
jgi:DNA invertase Pin-like site-specific DNA recombinase